MTRTKMVLFGSHSIFAALKIFQFSVEKTHIKYVTQVKVLAKLQMATDDSWSASKSYSRYAFGILPLLTTSVHNSCLTFPAVLTPS